MKVTLRIYKPEFKTTAVLELDVKGVEFDEKEGTMVDAEVLKDYSGALE